NIAGDVYVSIIPFVKDVNLGGASWNSTWIYWGDSTQDPSESDSTSWEALNGVCTSNTTYNNKRSNCSISGNNTQTACNSAGTCSLSSYTTQTTCLGAGSCSISGNTTQSSCQ